MESQAEGTRTRLRPTTSALYAAGTATPELVLPATDDAVLVAAPQVLGRSIHGRRTTEGGLPLLVKPTVVLVLVRIKSSRFQSKYMIAQFYFCSSLLAKTSKLLLEFHQLMVG